MTKGMIICVSEMSSSMMAKKVTDYFKEQGKDIEIDAMISSMGDDEIRTGDEDIFLISPQTKMYLETFQNTGKEVGKPVVSIPFDAYIPVPMGVEKLAQLVEANI